MQANGTAEFPEGFLWGAATAAYQIEGSTNAEGRGESIWDVFARNGGTHNGDTADIAADHYRRYPEDHAIAKDIGLGALRMSIAWPRIFPTGGGEPNQAGFDHYDRVIESLLAHALTPVVTLYHWDLPQALQEKGGWLNRDTASRFADYAEAVVRHFGDRVPFWITLNEPWSCAFLGYAQGLHAPGLRDYQAAGVVTHHLMLAHGLGLKAMRAHSGDAKIGITLCLEVAEPWSQSAADIAATELVDAECNRIFLDPLLRGSYPEEILPVLPKLKDPSLVRDGDLKLISAPIDFLGLNYYIRELVRADRSVPLIGARRLPASGPINTRGDGIRPEGIEQILLRPGQEYQSPVPLYVTEVGSFFNDYVTPEGKVHDPGRIAYLDTAFRAVASAMKKGADVRGIFVWTLIDDFEWDAGYSWRFGLTYVDYATQRRTLKSSAHWFRDVVRRNGLPSPNLRGDGRSY